MELEDLQKRNLELENEVRELKEKLKKIHRARTK